LRFVELPEKHVEASENPAAAITLRLRGRPVGGNPLVPAGASGETVAGDRSRHDPFGRPFQPVNRGTAGRVADCLALIQAEAMPDND